ncbi:type I restriction enzyme [Methylocella silvestris BL2]|uniref:Type I restriction enzyme n=1 Tax=Methylocella silvestris (strain DSM 15510 / CIP 108128 / LMG 27833 / NCIMB 13906 / BL2) TaxID=395965 RepID=B8EI19_METSB|nr:restriction endonuclease subunit S [Methylocella silvestris]ACK50501.1 type I restriction enzyme [Methylocella silvestris BL2]
MKSLRFKNVMRERVDLSETGEETLLSVSEYYGVKPRAEAFQGEEYESRAESLEGYRQVQRGDFVMNYMLAWKGAYGISEYDGIVSPAYAVFQIDKSKIDLKYLHHRTRSNPMRALFRSRSKGIIDSRLRLYPDALLATEIDLPGLAAQKVIADFLDRETARIDQLIEKKERFSALAAERWRATLDAEILGRTTAGKRSLTSGQPYISDVPADWVLTPLKHLVDPRRPVMYGIVLPGPNVENGIMIVKGGDVKPNRLSPDRLCKTSREIEAGYVRSRLRGGDLVMAIRGGIGDVEIVPADIEGANLTQDAARIAPRHGVLNRWLRYALQAPSVFAPLGAGANGAAVRGVNIFDVDRVLVPVPPTAEQIVIADRLDIKEQQILRMREKIFDHAKLIQEFRAALITAAVAGQINVDTWGKRRETDRRLDRIEEKMSAGDALA